MPLDRAELIERYQVTKGEKFRLKDFELQGGSPSPRAGDCDTRAARPGIPVSSSDPSWAPGL
jgi:hypothetical protein